jgi:hypothetical protein
LKTTILLVTAALTKQVFADNTNSLIAPTIALVIATGLLVWATWFYAIQTKKIVSETRNTANEMRRATEVQFLPSLITTFNLASAGDLSLYIKNIGRGPAKQIRVRISIAGNEKREEEHNIQLIEPGQTEQYFIDIGYPKDGIGYDAKKIYDYFKQHQTTVSIKLDYSDILEKEHHPDDQVIDVTKDIRQPSL